MHPRRGLAYFRNDLEGREILFAEPRDLIVAWQEDAFLPALDRVEQAQRAGRWLAGYISYEAGYLLDPALRDFLPPDRQAPLICFGVFDGPADPASLERGMVSDLPPFIAEPRATWSSARYRRRFDRLHRHLREGDCYQANLTFPVEARWCGDPLALFDTLTERQPVRYGAFVDFAGLVVGVAVILATGGEPDTRVAIGFAAGELAALVLMAVMAARN